MTQATVPTAILDGLFIHVRDLERSARWYSALLDLPLDEHALDRHYYTLNATHERPWITLDAHANDPHFSFAPAPHPICSFVTADLGVARERVLALGGQADEIMDVHPGLRALRLLDVDGNALMLVERR
ncbi:MULTISPECIES: VOC family protein [unclassified Deinococcus]|uniref:VOC family protein n=1 Tax=unclassified Deinococcus TaxID=2623546 RepID=UPI001C309D97|nr:MULTISPECIES: VOC family protein [unclassified Deinococcus]MDK2013486.1 hypothetical protein [Deinococcus sp. 43]